MPIAERQDLANILFGELGGETRNFDASQFFKVATESDNAIFQRASNAANGAKFLALWNGDASVLTGDHSQSAVDMALVNMLAFYSSDPKQIERLWLSSPQGQRHKTQERADYREWTIFRAFDRKLYLVDHSFAVNGQPLFTQAALPPEPQIIDVASWQGREPSPPQFVVTGWLPAGQVIYLTGKGASGKSLLGQQLCSCVALQHRFLGQPTIRGVTLYITCEDDTNELHRRQFAICGALGVTAAALARQMGVVSLVGMTGTELATFAHNHQLSPTPAFEWLKRTIHLMGAALVVLDNVAHFFSGDENNRHEVAAFVGLLNSLALETGAAIVLIGHPNKSGADYSGSTAWENQVRTRLYLEIPSPDGKIADYDARILTRAKANQARAGDHIAFRWQNHAFVSESELSSDVCAAIAANIRASAENAAFFNCLEAATKQRRSVSHHKGTNYAPAVFAKMPEVGPYNRIDMERALERLFHTGEIAADQFLWNDNYRKPKHGLKATQTCGDHGAATTCGEPLHPP